MSKKLGVFIGRFQPFHLGHLHIVKEALEQVDKLLILIGSSDGPRTYHNPFTDSERLDMIKDSLYEVNIPFSKIYIDFIVDSKYNDTSWIERVQEIATKWADDAEIYLVGHQKDHTSYYLSMFPNWKSISVVNYNGINSTDIRASYFKIKSGGIDTVNIPRAVSKFLLQFSKSTVYDYLKSETDFISEYRKLWSSAPYPPTFVTVDACVVQSGHILLIRRRSAPGKGLWALPGGYLNVKERIEDGMLRELREETKLKVPTPVLKGNIKLVRVFDDPERSARGRVITHAHLIHLPNNAELPKVKGSDDADKAKWFPLSEVKGPMMFEDHFAIIKNLTATL